MLMMTRAAMNTNTYKRIPTFTHAHMTSDKRMTILTHALLTANIHSIICLIMTMHISTHTITMPWLRFMR